MPIVWEVVESVASLTDSNPLPQTREHVTHGDSPSLKPDRSQPISFSESSVSHVLILLVLGAWLFGFDGGWMGGLEMNGLGLTDRDEGSNAEAAREMLETGNWISPTLNYEPRFAKPAFTYWLISGSYTLWGINEFAARFPSAVSGLCLILLQYLFVFRWCGAPIAWLSSIMLLFNLEFLGMNRLVLTDPELVLFTTLAGYSFWHAFHKPTKQSPWLFALFYLAMACAMLVKGPLGIIVPLAGVIPYLTLTRQWRRFWREGFPLLGTVLVTVVAAPWYVAMFQIHGDAYLASAQADTTGRFMNPMEGHGGSLLFYLPVLLVGFFPWSAFVPAVLYHAMARWKEAWRGPLSIAPDKHLELFLSLWVVALFGFFTLSATRLPHYIYPLFPPIAILVALWWKRVVEDKKPIGLRVSLHVLVGIGALLGIACIAVPQVLSMFMEQIIKEFPAAVSVDVGWVPFTMGITILTGTIATRMCMGSETKRHLAIWMASGMMVIFVFLVVKGVLPVYQQYFIAPPQDLATLAGLKLGDKDHLIQVGRKRPSLVFYAQRKVHFLGPRDTKEWNERLAAPGKTMIILQTHLRDEVPEAVSNWTVLQEHRGFALLSNETPL